jgi:hypothetical protein
MAPGYHALQGYSLKTVKRAPAQARFNEYAGNTMRAAIVHYWLMNRRGGEKVLEALCRLLPDADIFTLFCDPRTLSPALRQRRIHTSFLNPWRGHYRSLLPLMPMALGFDLRGYDLVVSSNWPGQGSSRPPTRATSVTATPRCGTSGTLSRLSQ